MLKKYDSSSADGVPGCYTDCYETEISRPVILAEFVFAFYTTWLFKLERVILGFLARRPSSDTEARQIAEGEIQHFAAWNLEDRSDDQLLMTDFRGRTRSWFMVATANDSDKVQTVLRFGSAVLPNVKTSTAEPKHGTAMKVLLGFHKLYSKALLSAAKSRLERLETRRRRR